MQAGHFSSAQLHVSLPFRSLAAEGPLFLAQGLQPEIAFKAPDLDEDSTFGEAERWGREFRREGLSVLVHAPFMDLNPGAIDPLVQQATATRLHQVFQAAELLGAQRLVVHPGYDRWRYGGNEDLWVEQCLKFWPPFIEKAAALGLILAVENVFEDVPLSLEKLFAALDHPHFAHCFDVGHWHLFCRKQVSLPQWFERLGARMVHLHLHDNFGERDDHLPPGEGLIPFESLFALAAQYAPLATLTLEVPDRNGLQRALGRLRGLFRSG